MHYYLIFQVPPGKWKRRFETQINNERKYVLGFQVLEGVSGVASKRKWNKMKHHNIIY